MIDGVVELTAVMYWVVELATYWGAVELVLVFGLLKIRIVMLKEGLCLSMSLPSSTMEIRWPLPGKGYRTMAFSMFTQKRRMAQGGFLTMCDCVWLIYNYTIVCDCVWLINSRIDVYVVVFKGLLSFMTFMRPLVKTTNFLT